MDAEALVRPLMDTHPYPWLAALGRSPADAVLEPDAVGGLGLVHATVPFEDVTRFRVEESTSSG